MTETVDPHTAMTEGDVHLEPLDLGESVLLMSEEPTTTKNPHFRSLRVRRASLDTSSAHSTNVVVKSVSAKSWIHFCNFVIDYRYGISYYWIFVWLGSPLLPAA